MIKTIRVQLLPNNKQKTLLKKCGVNNFDGGLQK